MLKSMGFALSMVLFIVFKITALANGSEIDHPLFDANHCLERFQTTPSGDTVEFYWGCGETKYITMECVYDNAGYQDLGRQYLPGGWHCNWPLPALRLDGVSRIADVAVRSAGKEKAWAGCFVNSYGDFNSPKKPYHDTACYRALQRIHTIVNQTQRDPRKVAKDLLKSY
jgi:hypothetical protein